jgi:DNA modification methylase/ParB-like chromosome segregation protein Spo0J
MKNLPISSIQVRDRQRKEIDPESLRDMKRSISERGLFSPILVNETTEGLFLTGGETRLRAVTDLYKEENFTLFHADKEVPENHIPAIVYSNKNELDAITIELEENIVRTDLNWKDRAEALARIYELRKAEEPTISKTQTAKELSEKTGESHSTLKKQMTSAVLIDKYKDEPSVSNARTHKEAYRAAQDVQLRRFNAELERRTNQKIENTASRFDLRHGDCIEIMQKMDEKVFDMIICDPPYGYNAGSYFPNSTEVKHLYDDTPENAKKIAKAILTEGFRITKPKAGVLLFCKPTMWQFLHDFSKQMAWTPWPNPIVWDKTRGGSAPWGKLGPRRRYELMFWATKGERGLTNTFDEIISIPHMKKRDHAAEKPVELMEFLVKHFTSSGEKILDPCMGSGATIVAAVNLKRIPTGIEQVEDYYNMAVGRMANLNKEEKKSDLDSL